MNLLFIPTLLNGDYKTLFIKISIIVLFWILILIAVLIDLHYGIKASKATGIFKTHSYGLRKTGRKLLEYWTIMLLAFFVDFGLSCLQLAETTFSVFHLFTVPFLSIGLFVGILITEIISVKEKIEKVKGGELIPKSTINVISEVLEKLGEGGEDKLKALAEILKGTTDKKEEEKKDEENK